MALWQDGQVLDRTEMAPRRHAELVLPMAESLLAEAGITRRQLDGIAMGRGPGAFTGVRLAVSVAQGLAMALDIPVVPISSLAALAVQAPRNGAATLVVIDARRAEIYAAAFLMGTEGINLPINSLRPLLDECVISAGDLVLPPARAWNVIGTGWGAYADALRGRFPAAPVWADGERYPQARDVATLAAPVLAAGKGVAPEFALPVYLRDKVALTLQEQHAAARVE